MTEFIAWPKTPRLFRDIVITEKIDGTNACVIIEPAYEVEHPGQFDLFPGEAIVDGWLYRLTAQSRKRIIVPGADNYGFAAWVHNNATALVALLGAGRHYGEWWGKGIQRGYGMESRSFSLFNTAKFAGLGDYIGGTYLDSVPVLYEGPFSGYAISAALHRLDMRGSVAAPGFYNPEGVCVFHSQSRQVFKVTLDHNDAGKWEASA